MSTKTKAVNQKTPLEAGDVFILKKGHQIYMELPEHFVYDNRRGVFDQFAKTEVVVGVPKGGMNTGWLAGRYVVISAHTQGGGTGHGPNDVYPDGLYITAERFPTKDSSIADGGNKRWKIYFYQSGCFTSMIEPGKVEKLGKAKVKYVMEA